VVLEHASVLEAARVDGVVTGVANQLFGDLPRPIVGAVQVRRPGALGVNLVVDQREVEVERLGGWAADDGLDLVRERLELLVAVPDCVRRVDRQLSVDAGDPAERVRDFAGGNCDENDVRVRRVSSVSPELLNLMSGVAPPSRKPRRRRCPYRPR
jgi:hypothetical protein